MKFKRVYRNDKTGDFDFEVPAEYENTANKLAEAGVSFILESREGGRAGIKAELDGRTIYNATIAADQSLYNSVTQMLELTEKLVPRQPKPKRAKAKAEPEEQDGEE